MDRFLQVLGEQTDDTALGGLEDPSEHPQGLPRPVPAVHTQSLSDDEGFQVTRSRQTP